MLTAAERRTTISLTPASTPRLLMQQARAPGSPGTLLDGGWWPRSSDPVAELPGLILAIEAQHRPVTRVMLRRADWDSHPRRLRVDGPGSDLAGANGSAAGRVVRLGWFDTMPAGLLTATRADGRRTDLLIVPPPTNEPAARAAMQLAADPSNHIHTPDILAALAAPPITAPATRTDQPAAETAPENVWESEGGRLADTPMDRVRPVPLPVGDRRSP
jgi:hypothetical protein